MVVTGDVTNAAGKTKRIVISVVEFEETPRDPVAVAKTWKEDFASYGNPKPTTEVIPVSMFDNDADKQAAKLTGFATVSPDAQEFWEAYPRKIKKGQLNDAYAVTIWRIVQSKSWPDTEAHAFLMGKVKEYARSPAGREFSPDYRPSPASWLVDERWNDDPSQWQIPNGKKKTEDAKPKVEPLKKKGAP